MPLLLIDDRDGRIVAEIETAEQAHAIVRRWAVDDLSLPDYLCLVRVDSSPGEIFGVDTSVKVRPLSRRSIDE
jgi:hypothetical protein